MSEQLGYGTTLSWNGVVVAGLNGINGIELTVDTVDATTHPTSGGDYYKKSLPGLIEVGDVALEGYFDYTDTTGQQAMLTDLNGRTPRTGVITFPAATGTTWTFTGFITNLKIGDAPVDGLIPFSATIKPTGKPTLAVATVTGMSAVAISDSVLVMPTFAIGTFEYVVTITNGTASCAFTPVDSTSGEVITITANGASQVVNTGAASTEITLSATATTDVVVVISATNKAPKTYKFHLAVLAA